MNERVTSTDRANKFAADFGQNVTGIVVKCFGNLDESQRYTVSQAKFVPPRALALAPDLHSEYQARIATATLGPLVVTQATNREELPPTSVRLLAQKTGCLKMMKGEPDPTGVVLDVLAQKGKHVLFPSVQASVPLTVLGTTATRIPETSYPLQGTFHTDVVVVGTGKEIDYTKGVEGVRVYINAGIVWNMPSQEIIDDYRAGIGASAVTAYAVRAGNLARPIISPMGGQPEKKKR